MIHLYVDPAHWGQGIGSALFDHATAECGPLRLWAFRDNTAARDFYSKRGLTVIDETDGQNDEDMPDVCMAQVPLQP
ncbi:MAG: GNAT family N-acetyltransferase [Planktomarina sp.]